MFDGSTPGTPVELSEHINPVDFEVPDEPSQSLRDVYNGALET
jgi:hypothetical protein